MIHFDATLILQIIHFLVAWFLLDYFLFRKIIPLVQEEDKKTDVVHELIAHEKELCQLEKTTQALIVEKRKQLFLQHAPHLKQQPAPAFSSLVCPIVDMPETQKEALSQEICTAIVTKVLS